MRRRETDSFLHFYYFQAAGSRKILQSSVIKSSLSPIRANFQ